MANVIANVTPMVATRVVSLQNPMQIGFQRRVSALHGTGTPTIDVEQIWPRGNIRTNVTQGT